MSICSGQTYYISDSDQKDSRGMDHQNISELHRYETYTNLPVLYTVIKSTKFTFFTACYILLPRKGAGLVETILTIPEGQNGGVLYSTISELLDGRTIVRVERRYRMCR